MSLFYFQKDKSHKEMIVVEMSYDGFEKINQDQKDGHENVFYTLNFEMQPYSHLELTIKFAFGPRFYIVLYLIVGLFTMIIGLCFTIYHRCVARKKGNAKIAEAKFRTYFKLTIPPAAEGISLALAPVMLADVIIALVITGRLMGYTFFIFSCNEADEDSCPMTLFD